MEVSELLKIKGLQFMPVLENKKPIHDGWQVTAAKYDFSKAEAVGLVCGKLSGNLEAVDVDLKYDLTGVLFKRFKNLVMQLNPHLLAKLVVQKTVSNGYHLIYRCSFIEGNQKLASRPANEEEKAKGEKVKVLLETRGEGGYIACYPTKGYELVYGDFSKIQTITPDERSTLINAAFSFNEVLKPVVHHDVRQAKTVAGTSPIEDYNNRADVVALLELHGWSAVGRKGKKILMKRPGDTKAEHSGNYDEEKNWFSVFSTSTEFESQTPYLPYAVFCVLECGKDWKLVPRRLYELGYGDREEQKKEVTVKVPSIVEVDDDDLSFLATEEDYNDYLHRWRTKTFEMGKSTGIPELDAHFLFKEGNLVIVNGIDNVGKALALDTPIPTPYGWTTMEKLKVGDDIFGEDGKVCEIIFATEVMYGKKTYDVIFSNGEKITCCEDHLWKVKTISGFTKVMSVKEMISFGVKRKFKQKTLSSFSIDMPSPLKMPKRNNFIINPYTLGAWLGDGDSNSNRITSSFEDITEMSEIINDDGYETRISINEQKIQIITGNFTTRLRCLSVYKNKHIPSEYLRASISERVELLQGLMDTDGYVSVDGRLEFCNKSPQVADGFMELISSLGLKYSCSRKTPSINGLKMNYKAYYISFSCALDTFPVFKLKRKVDKMSAERPRGRTIQIIDIVEVNSVPVKCIQVNNKSKLFLCGRTMIPTHNSTVVWYLAMLSALQHDWNWVLFSSENRVGGVIRKLIEFYWCEPINELTEAKFAIAKKFVNEHFSIIKTNDKMFNYQDILNMAVKAKRFKNYKGLLIDPYNSLKVEIKSGSKQQIYDYHYEAASVIQLFCKHNNISVYLNCHVGTAGARNKDKAGFTKAPQKEDTEGGVMFSNKADEFITIHRVTQHAENWKYTEIHVRKVKETETGGRVTYFHQPIDLTMVNEQSGFISVPKRGAYGAGTNAVLCYHNRQSGLPIIDYSKPTKEQAQIEMVLDGNKTGWVDNGLKIEDSKNFNPQSPGDLPDDEDEKLPF